MSTSEQKGFNGIDGIGLGFGFNGIGSGPSDADLIRLYKYNAIAATCVDINAKAFARAAKNIHLYKIKGGKGVGKGSKPVNKDTFNKIRKRVQKAFTVGSEAELEEIISHPILNTYRRMNKTHTGYDVAYAYSASTDVLGRYFLLKNLDEETGEEILEPLEAHLMKPILEKGTIVSWRYGTGTNYQTYQAEEIISWMLHPIDSFYNGWLSPLSAVYPELSLTMKMTEFQTRMAEGKAAIQGTWVNEEGWNDDTKERHETNVENKFIHGQKRHAYVDGKIKFIPTFYPPTDLGPLEIGNNAERRAVNRLGVPEALLSKDATYSNLDASQYQHAILKTAPQLWQWEEKLNEEFVSMFEDADNLFICFDDPVPENKEHELKVKAEQNKALQFILPTGCVYENEARAAAGLPPVDGGDDRKVTLTPSANASTVTPEATGSEAPISEPVTEEQAPAVATNDLRASVGGSAQILAMQTACERGEISRDAAIANATLVFGFTPEQADQLFPTVPPKADTVLAVNEQVAAAKMDRATAINIVAKSYNLEQKEAAKLVTYPPTKATACECCVEVKAKKPKPLKADGKKLVPIIRDEFKRQKEHYLSIISETKGVSGGIAKAFGRKAADNLPEKFTPIEEWDMEFAHKVKPVVEFYTGEGSNDAATRIGASADAFSVEPAKINEAADKSSLKFAQSTNSTTAQNLNNALAQLRQEIKDGLFAGDTIKEMRNRVLDVFENAEVDRAELIAQSEASRAIHEGVRIAAKESGIVKGFKLLVSEDACPLCLEFQDKEIGLDEKFNDGDDYDDSMLPIHPGCTCTVTEVLDLDALAASGEGEEDE